MNVKKLIRPNILSLKPYTAARHSHISGILLDANENSLGTVPNGFDELPLNRYPDPYQKELRSAASEYFNIKTNNLFFGVGSDEIIDLLIRVFCVPSIDNIIVCEPTYGMYKVCADINDIAVKNVPLNSDYDIDEDAIIATCDENTKIIFLCSPNNPTSNLLSKDKIISLTKKLNVVIVVDEAYIDFAQNKGFIDQAAAIENLVVLRTFSKAWGMAAIRCGFCVASEEVIEILFRVKAPYNLNILSMTAAVNAIKNYSRKDYYVEQIIIEKQRVYQFLSEHKKILKVIPSDSNFISFQVNDPKEIFMYLEKSGIIIRDRSGQYNFAGFLRVTIGSIEENDIFINKLNEALS